MVVFCPSGSECPPCPLPFCRKFRFHFLNEVGTEWQLIQLGGETVRPEKGTFTLTLLAEGNRLTAVGACNRLSGIYKTDDKRTLKLGPIASTMMACPGMEREHAFAQALEATTHYDMDGPMLLLLSNGELKAVFQAKP